MLNYKLLILFIIFFTGISLTGVAETSDPAVYQVQKKLKELGYDPGSPDGIWGKKTISAIRRFQLDNGLPVTGKLDEQTRAKLIFKKHPSQVSFIEAIKKDDSITIKALIDAGADVNAKDKLGETPLHIAAVRGYNEITSLLIAEGADVNPRNKDGMTPLHAAALTGQKEAIELLIDKGAVINAKNKNGVTPLQIAKHKGHQSIVELLQKF